MTKSNMIRAAAVLAAPAAVLANPTIIGGGSVSGERLPGPELLGSMVSGAPIVPGVSYLEGPTTVYSNLSMDGDLFALQSDMSGADNGVAELIAEDDYISTSSEAIELASLVFVGGVDQAGGVLIFEFFSGNMMVESFAVQFEQAGDFVYTIEFDDSYMIAGSGRMRVLADDEGEYGVATTGSVFLGSEAPTIGSTTENYGYTSFLGDHLDAKFGLVAVPGPGVGVVGAAGLLLAARRRRG